MLRRGQFEGDRLQQLNVVLDGFGIFPLALYPVEEKVMKSGLRKEIY